MRTISRHQTHLHVHPPRCSPLYGWRIRLLNQSATREQATHSPSERRLCGTRRGSLKTYFWWQGCRWRIFSVLCRGVVHHAGHALEYRRWAVLELETSTGKEKAATRAMQLLRNDPLGIRPQSPKDAPCRPTIFHSRLSRTLSCTRHVKPLRLHSLHRRGHRQDYHPFGYCCRRHPLRALHCCLCRPTRAPFWSWFHQILSGRSGSFWNTRQVAQFYWFSQLRPAKENLN